MKSRVIAVVSVLACIAGTPAFAQQKPMTPDDVAKIKADVIKAANNYLATFSKQDFKGIADKVYSHPAIAINADGVQIIDPVKQAEGMAKNVEAYKKGGWASSDFHDPKVCVINANVALMSSVFRRLDKDGKVYMEGAETDLFARTADGWKMVGLFAHSPSKTIICND